MQMIKNVKIEIYNESAITATNQLTLKYPMPFEINSYYIYYYYSSRSYEASSYGGLWCSCLTYACRQRQVVWNGIQCESPCI